MSCVFALVGGIVVGLVSGGGLPGELVVKVRVGASEPTFGDSSVTFTRAFPAPRGFDRAGLGRVMRVRCPTGDENAWVERLRADPAIEWAEANSAGSGIQAAPLPNDTFFTLQWHLHQTSDIDLDVPEAWQLRGTFTADPSLVVAVVDSGFPVTTTIPDLVGSHWTNAGEIQNGLDDDGNGYVDDLVGYDFVVGNPNPDGGHLHGMWVSSVIAARTNNASDIAGIAPGVKLMHLRSFGNDGDFPVGGPFPGKLAAAAALLYAVDNGADLINNSWHDGTGPTQVILDAVQYVKDNGVLGVFGAGNDGILGGWPSQHPACFSVAGIAKTGAKSSFSNYGPFTDVMAAAESIPNIDPSGVVLGSGTSEAAPMVTGIAALLLSEDATLPRIDLERLLELGCTNLDALNPAFVGLIGAGLVNAERSLRLLLPATDLGFGKPGATSPRLHAYGGTQLGATFAITVSDGPPGAAMLLVIGAAAGMTPFGGGTLVPVPSLVVPAALDPDGILHVELALPVTLPLGPVAHLQAIVADPGSTLGAALTNALRIDGL